jgi:hypothetical protein
MKFHPQSAAAARRLEEPQTAYVRINDERYEAEIKLLDRYQSFSAELLRLSLLGIAALGFFYKDAFLKPQDHMYILQPHISVTSAVAALLFAGSAAASLTYRYMSTEAMRLYIEGIKLSCGDNPSAAQCKLTQRGKLLEWCIIAKIVATIALGLGTILLSVVFIFLLIPCGA